MYAINYTDDNGFGVDGIAYFEIGYESDRDEFIAAMNAQFPDRYYTYTYVSETF